VPARPLPEHGSFDLFRNLGIAAEGVGELHLARRPAFHLEYLRRADQDRYAVRARFRDIETVQAVKELDAARRVGVA
jgi:hypothetical protein